MKDKLYQFIFGSDLYATRVILAISEFVWGIALVSPGETFTRSKTYSGMAEIASEPTWGCVWLLSALIQTYILYKGDYHSKPAVWFAAINSSLWWFVVISLYIHVWPLNAVASADVALAIGATWVWFRSGWEPKPIRGAEQWM